MTARPTARKRHAPDNTDRNPAKKQTTTKARTTAITNSDDTERGELDDFNVEGTVWETKVEQKRRHFLFKGKCARCMFSLKRVQWAQITRECDAGLTAHR